MKLKTEAIKTLLIIILAAFSLQLWFAYNNTKEKFISFIDFTKKNSEKDVAYDFKSKIGYIQTIENGNTNDATYLLYYSAILDLKRIDENTVKTVSSSEIREFRKKYHSFMEKQCSNEDYKACVRYGDILLEQHQYDLAHSAYLKAAENENYEAMSRLAYLYANKNWANNSEENSEEWFIKIGRNSGDGLRNSMKNGKD